MKVTVVTVTRNAAGVIERTVQSVLEQTGVELEYIVLDGASTDATLELLERYRDHIDILRSEPDRGIYDAMNKAARSATGDMLLYMNAGDVFSGPHALSRLLACAPAHGESVVFGCWAIESGDGSVQHRQPDLPRGIFNHQATLYSRSIHGWHGDYLCVRGLSAADFVFFRTLQASNRIAFVCCAEEVALIDPFGLSAGLQTYLQRVLVDTLCGFDGRYTAAAKMLIHPAYHRVKRLLKGGR